MEEDRGIVTLTLVPPEGKPPTLDGEVLDVLAARLLELAPAPHEVRLSECQVDGQLKESHLCRPRVLVIASASQKYFCAGANIRVLQTTTADTIGAWVRRGHDVFMQLEQLSIPVVARVSGYALGGGLELALACDQIIADANAIMGQTEARLGLLTGWGASVRLPERVGAARAKQLFFSGDLLSAGEAKEIGLVDEVASSENLDRSVGAFAAKVSLNSAGAIAAFKRIINDEQTAARRRNREREAEFSAECLRDADTGKRMSAFLAERSKKKAVST